MRTRTIYAALGQVRESSAFFATEKRVRQAGTFERELLRRMDERDALATTAWHPISETPPTGTPLLLMTDDGSAHIAGYIHRWTGQLAYCNIDENWGDDAYANRTHWRTMPQPPPGMAYAELDGLYGPAGDK